MTQVRREWWYGSCSPLTDTQPPAARRGLSVGVAYKRPLTPRSDILKQRISVNLLLER